MNLTQLRSASRGLRFRIAARALTASFVSICNHAADSLRSVLNLLLAFTVLSCSIASAQTAHLSQAQIVLNLPTALDWPQAVAVDANGSIYVADPYNHRVLKLTPSGGGLIQSTVGTGFNQPYGVAVDAGGNVYISDIFATTLFKETPNGNGGYTQSTIGSELYDAVSVAVDKQGNVYGTETNNSFIGTLFKETFSGGVYTQSFIPVPGTHGVDGVAVDGNGDLFLNDGWDGRVYEDTPLQGGDYTTTQIYNSSGALAVDSQNNLYIIGYPGYIAKLTPNGSGGFTTGDIPVDENTVPTPYGYFSPAGLAVDANGDLFFDDLYTFNLIEESMSGANFGQVPVTATAYPVSMYFTFDTGGTMGSYSIVTDGVPNTEFTDSTLGNCPLNLDYLAGSVCNIDVSFTPAAPGTRPGAVVLNDGNGNPFATGYVQGTGVSPLVDFQGAAPAPLISGLNEPLGITVDASGNVLVANAGTGNVLLTTTAGSQSQVGSGFNHPTGVAEDGAGNIFVAQSGIIYEVAKTTGVQTQLNLSGLSDPNDLAVDGTGNLYVSEPNLGKVVKVTPSGVQTNVGTGLSAPRGIAVDAGGNVYIADYSAGSVFVVAPSGSQSAITGFQGPSGVAVDAAGNVYVAVYGSGELVEVSPGGTQTPLAYGLAAPYAVALDANGNLYFTEYASGAVQKIDRVDAPSLSFAGTVVGQTSSDSPRTVTLSNDGNAALTFPIPASGDDPSISTNFTLNSSATDACPLVSAGSPQPGTLAAGSSCLLPISFTPETGGSLTGSLALTDTNLNAASPNYAVQTIQLSGNATPNSPTINSVSPILPKQTQTIAINGSGFGSQSAYTGNSSYIELTDITGSSWNAGHTGDSTTLAVSSWTDTQIVLSGLSGAYGTHGWCIRPGDQLSVRVWNATNGNGPSVYPIAASSGTDTCAPAIKSVSAILPQQTQTITITGQSFGSQAAYTGPSSYIELTDTTGFWNAGHTGNAVTFSVSSWTDTQIVLTGLSGEYGAHGWCIRPGDQLSVSVWNANTGGGPSVYPVTASSGTDTCPPAISAVSQILPQQTQTVTITGAGFGSQSSFTGTSSYLELTDITGSWNAGHTGDAVAFAVSSWTDTQIVLSGLSGDYGSHGWCIRPGDQLSVSVWNANTGSGPAVYPVVAASGTDLCSTTITAVSPILPQQTQTITITGEGFGTQSAYTGGSSYIELTDTTAGSWNAGHTGDAVTFVVSSWTDKQIVITGLSGEYATHGWCISPGDKLSFSVWNAQTGKGPAVYPITASSGANTCP